MRALLLAASGALALAFAPAARSQEMAFFADEALTDSMLAGQSGRQGVSIASIASIQTSSSANVVSGPSTTGANSVGVGAFADLSGVASVLMNSGNNVVMSNVTIVNVALH